jgi:CheY-like chemotaxis protein/two-component sensor histidine kinase
MAKIEANKLELLPGEFNFDSMLEKVLTIIRFRVEEKKQRLSVNVDNNIPGFLVGDDQRLSQVLTNLLFNAVKFTPEGGEIRFNASLSGETPQFDDGGVCELRIEVADSGIGISPEQKERLFSAFEQAETGISRAYGGTGLGLAITKRIVELMDGKIWVESELGKGARFIFTVKARCGSKSQEADESPVSGQAETAADDGNFEGKKLLLVEDIDINREILMALLEDTEIAIDCAENGQEALDMIEADPEKYDLVFMDVQMPKMDGLEATRRIRALPEPQRGRLPIVAMTANVFKSDIERCLEAGMDDHLGKPLEIDKVFQVLRKYL